MKNITHRTVVQDHHLTQIRLHRAEVLDICTIPESTVLTVVPRLEVFPLLLEPVNDWIRILLHTGSEDDQLVPLGNLAQELITVGSLVYVIQDGMLRTQSRGWSAGCECSRHRRGQFDLNHVATGHAAALGQGMDERLIQIKDQSLLRALRKAEVGRVRRHTGWNQRARRDGRMRIPGDPMYRRRCGRFETVQIESTLNAIFRCLAQISTLRPALPLSLERLFAMKLDPDRASRGGLVWRWFRTG